ncbi:MAG: DUF3574 domain-containing protein [Acetobacteraceae bacterium]|nr:DUF3574 domain-containing protein [Acetobacteraceae bacterium]
MIIFWKSERKNFFGTRWYSSLLSLLFLSGCGANQCPAGAGQSMRVYDLYFGRSVSGRGEVTDKEWRDFRNEIVTPALPNGYTVLDGQGAWLNPRSRSTIAEATKVLRVAMPDTAESQSIVNRIRGAWQRRFHQYVVGMTVQTACGSFSPSEAP